MAKTDKKPPADQIPVDTVPADTLLADLRPVNTIPVMDKPPVDKPPVDKPPVDKPPVDKPPMDKPPAGNNKKQKTTVWILVALLVVAAVVILLLCLRSCGSSGPEGSQSPSANQPAKPDEGGATPAVPTAPADADPVQVDWSDWMETLPDFVTAEDYEIQEKTFYSTAEKEFTSSTEDKSLAGWEHYDTVKSGAGYGNWSGWTDEYVEETATRQVEAKTFYQYQDKELTTSSSPSLDGWEHYDTTYVLSEPGPWSEWSTTVYEPSETRTVRSDTQYRSAQREWTQSTNTNLSGWNLESSYVDYTDYGGWSSWSTTPAYGSVTREVRTATQYSYRWIDYELVDLGWSDWSSWSFDRQSTDSNKKEESRTVWGYYYFQCPKCGQHMHGWNITCFQWAGGCGQGYIPQSSWHQIYSPVSWNDAGLKDFHGTGKYYTTLNGERVFKWTEGGTRTQYRYATWLQEYQKVEGSWSGWSMDPVYSSDNLEVRTRTVYSYRDRGAYDVYVYSRWGNYSGWGFDYIEPNENLAVQSRTVYSYQDCEKLYTYYYYRWTDWSGWSENPVSASDTRNVEEKVRYRYKDQINETTYYFYRWGPWSAWSEMPATASDTLDVKTVTLYSYKSK